MQEEHLEGNNTGENSGYQNPYESTFSAPPNMTTEDTSSITTEPPQTIDTPGLAWQASEYIEHEKDMKWYLLLLVIVIVLLVVDYFLIQSWTFALLIVVMAAAVVLYAKRPAQVMEYRLTPQSLTINDKHFSLHDFRAFGVVKEGSFYSVSLIPLKRFSPAVNVYFPPEDGEQIVDVFGSVMPMQELKTGIIDKLANKIRF